MVCTVCTSRRLETKDLMDRDLELAGLKGGVTSTLFARTMLCLVGLLAISGATSVLSWGVALSGAVHIALFVSALV